MNPHRRAWLGIAWGLSLSACFNNAAPPTPLSPAERALYATDSRPHPDWTKAAWIERASRALRAGRGLDAARPEEKLEALLPLDRERIVDILMAHPAFTDGVLDFNLFFLGAKVDRLRDEGGVFVSHIFGFPQAISSARALAASGDGNYLSLFELSQPFFVDSFRRPYSPDEGDQKLSDSDLRTKIMGIIQARIASLILKFEAAPQTPLKEACNALIDSVNTMPGFFTLGLPIGITSQIFSRAGWFGQIFPICFPMGGPSGEAAALLAPLRVIVAKNAVFFERVSSFEKNHAPGKDLEQLPTFELGDLVAGFKSHQFAGALAQKLVNSSTNYNRKRAAYVLKRFFCDDLTPIGVEAPAAHARDRHGSDPACLACHYKLDPMAGFFMDRGAGFDDFGGAPRIFFDDGASADRGEYENQWRAPEGAGRGWDVGYVRSSRDPGRNDYGRTLDDLFGIIRRAPEAKACLVRRMFEYYVGADRARDPGYLAELARDFARESARGRSGAAFRATARRLVLSQSFAALDPEPGRCYDRVPGGGAAPCEIAYLLEKNCASCHGGNDGGLNLSSWEIRPDGRWGFAHVDSRGRPHTARETFVALADRLSTPDPDRRMPMGGWLDPLERESLYIWAHGLADAP